MKLENWLKKFDIKKMAMEDLEHYIIEFEKKDKKAFDDFFENVDLKDIEYKFLDVAYVINTLYEERKYISAQIRLHYEDMYFAGYQVIYDFEGNFKEDYLTKG